MKKQVSLENILEMSTKENPGKSSIKGILSILAITYLVLVTMFFCVSLAFSWSWYVSDGKITNFCIHVPVSEKHDLALGEKNACLIDWWPFLKEAIFFPVLLYGVLICPGVFLWCMTKAHPKQKKL